MDALQKYSTQHREESNDAGYRPHSKRLPVMLKIGLTGGIGSGKTFVADLFARYGVGLIDADQIAHAITAPGGAAVEPIRAAFGTDFIDPNGALDRVRMRHLVFADTEAKRRLEAITHPLIRNAFRREAERLSRESNIPYLIEVVPLLIESGDWKNRVDRVLVVDCPVETQIARVMHRSGLTRAEVQAIIARQVTREDRLAAANDVIDNSGMPDAVSMQVDALHDVYLKLARQATADEHDTK